LGLFATTYSAPAVQTFWPFCASMQLEKVSRLAALFAPGVMDPPM
jgi:hypothetical protein